MAKTKTEEYKNKPVDFILCITVLLLLALGIVMVLSASSPSSFSETGNSYTFVKQQAFSAGIGLVAMFIISKIDYRIYKPLYKLAYIGSIGLLALVPLIGVEAGGAKRWIDLGFMSFQPSELAKIGLIVFFAAFLSERKDKLKHIWHGFGLPFALVAPAAIILVLFQEHFSATLIIVAVMSIMMIVAGSKISHFLTLGLAGGTALVAYIFTQGAGFRMDRINAWLDPWADPTGDAWQAIQSLYAIGSGGLFGAGLGQSKQKYLYIPEPHNDFIFSILAEELGFIGCAIVILLFAVFIWRGVIISMKAPDMFGSLLAVGITALVGLQAIINIAVVTASIPVTGMPLPFFSYGGTALIILLCGVRSATEYIKTQHENLRLPIKKFWKKFGDGGLKLTM